ncbi:DNA polymerase IV [Bacillus solimangrovi]|uniref:DNA polymerase IV n=1 Tax=Bacillus solimangrovi TaxID=1305675 RepID=A0A1E5LKB1_9BACI|nr:DNA polymerase IV [Bacillus solimangrovi]OEH94527.1 DNA polymerase IV [Bacillus solimangrovi]
MKEMYPKQGRVILHVDMNSFYASVEMANDPSLKGKPLAIAGNPKERRGIIVTSSYEARAKGVKTTMTLWQAKRLCPELIVRRPNFPLYRQTSIAMFQILSRYASLVQPVSIDEGYMDITSSSDLGSPVEIAKQIQFDIMNELDLPCSIGVAPNKFLAKTASDMKKPMGITVLRKRDVQTKLWPLPVVEMHGIGERTAEKLNSVHIQTIGELANADDYTLKELLGINGIRLKERANGIDNSVVDPDALSDFKSIGNSKTLPDDTTDEAQIRLVLQELSSSVAKRMNRQGMVSWNIQLTMRYHDRKTITRSRKLSQSIDKEADIFEAAYYLFNEHWNDKPIRLLGVTAQQLEEKAEAFRQLDLFSYTEEVKKEPLYETIQSIRDKYGENSIKKGKDVRTKRNVEGGEKHKGTSFQKDFLRHYRFGSKEEQ